MPPIKLVLYDDEIARSWEPFALTRPAGEMLFGTMTLRARAERSLGLACAGQLTASHLHGFEEPGAAPVLGSPEEVEGDRVFLLSRFVPALGGKRPAEEWAEGPVTSAGRLVGWYAPAGRPVPMDTLYSGDGPPEGAQNEVAGDLLEKVWQLMSLNPARVTSDVEALFPVRRPPSLPAGAHHWGDHPLVVDEGARIEPGSAFDTTGGPIWLDRGSIVRAFTRLAGPTYIGRDSVVLGGSVEAVSIGPVCRVRGELAESVCVGYVNKQHDGHIGHAYLGRWVNLGAETSNSDLKNNYGTVRVWTPGGDVDTGEIKIGSLIGDHVKTGIGLLLNTGTVIGAGSNLYGADLPPKFVPPFSWGTGNDLAEFRLDKFLEVAERAMARRRIAMTEGLRDQLTRSWERGRAWAGV